MTRSLHRMFEMKGETSSSNSGNAHEFSETEGLTSVTETIRNLTSAMQAARTQGMRTFSELARSTQEWSNVTTKATTQVLAILSQHNVLETNSVAAHAKAEQAKSLATLSALKQTAFYKAIAATAAGFQALGDFDFWAAAQDFTSAALWGTVAGGQIAAMAGSGRGSGARTPRGSEQGFDRQTTFPTSGLAAGAAVAAHPPSGHLTVAVMGDSEAGEWLAKTLNTAVEQRGVQLTSTRSTRSAYAAG